ncbi:MAG: ribose-5-phosphate isomerase RpiA [Thermomicrobiales bacterium]|nr:ribose-5-phosphate isomerase RpiA [Thermomicrobiales bacterium]
MDEQARLSKLAAAAADLVQPGMIVGLGTGSTASAVVEELGRRVAKGLPFTGVTTSARTEDLARSLNIPLLTLDDVEALDLTLDGADEIDPALNAVKGRGGALLMEKLVALASTQFVLVASSEKNVAQLGVRLPLPVEVVRFGWKHTANRLAALGLAPRLRTASPTDPAPYVTDQGNYILDCGPAPITDVENLAREIKATPGVVEHGLFVGIAAAALQITPDGTLLYRTRST